MAQSQKMAVVILNYNGFKHTIECIASLRKSSFKSYSLIVVDNASTDGSLKKLKQFLLPGEAKIIELYENGGYTYGNNVGVEYAFKNGSDYAFIINNDIILDKNCIGRLVSTMLKDKSIGILGPKVLYYSKPDIINYAGISGSIGKAKYVRFGMNKKDDGKFEKLIDTLYQDGCAILISRKCYEEIGGFDELFWTYWEESDLCFRARYAGYRVCCLQNASVWHKISATLGQGYYRKTHSTYYGVRNSYIFHRRYTKNFFSRVLVIILLLSRTPMDFVSILFKQKKSKAKNLWMLITATLVGILTNSKIPRDTFAPIKAVKK
jgi:GT2 family glycosyltransferase